MFRVLITRKRPRSQTGGCVSSSCTNQPIAILVHHQIAVFPKYTHYGEITDGVDMRAEVALLSRNIVIEGHMEDMCPEENDNCKQRTFDTYGGHIKVC